MPLVPLWGVWADKYSRKAVIVRSAIVEAVVFTGMALAREPWHVAVSVLLIGFQLGNTGVMLAGIRDATPRHRLGTVIAIFGASGPVGFAVAALAGIHRRVRLGAAAGLRLRPRCRSGPPCSSPSAQEVRPKSSRRRIAISRSPRGGASSTPTRRIFVIFGISFV
jgi:hypothetical protein